MAWDDTNIETLKGLWLEGKSAAFCAYQLNQQYGTTFSRNAVIGKLHRMGLKRGDLVSSCTTRWIQKPRTPKTKQARRATYEAVAMARRVGSRDERVDAPLPEEKGPAVVVSPNPVSFSERAFGQCAAPVSGSGFDMIVCGNECQGGQSYCPGHRSIYYRPFVAKDRELMRLAKRFA